MTIRRQWLMVLILIAIASVSINALILSTLTDRYFVDYLTEAYNEHLDQIIKYAGRALTDKDYSMYQLTVELESHLREPITRIQIFDESSRLLADIDNLTNNTKMHDSGMMDNMMMNRFLGGAVEAVDTINLNSDGKSVGYLLVSRYSSLENTVTTRLFKSNLIRNSFLAVGIVTFFSIIIGLFVSKRMSRALSDTAAMAQSIDIGESTNVSLSKVSEIRFIQERLQALGVKLKLKQKSRKQLTDEVIHQSRTPLTILKTHLEGFEDGLIDLSHENFEICFNQIEHVSTIIANLNGLIEAEKQKDIIHMELINFNHLITQIEKGLKPQFDKKHIQLSLLNNENVMVNTDQYKMSQVLYNLLTNAYKFTDEGGKVTLDYRTVNGELEIQIKDNGRGISKKDIGHVFDAYYRGENSGIFFGEGIGLYIVKENLDLLGARIHVDSEISKGTIFTIRFSLE